MKKKSSVWLLFAAVLIIPITAFALVTWYERSMGNLPVYYSSIDKSYRTYQFSNQNRNAISFSDWDNKIVVANFFFTHCPVVCPKMTKNLRNIQQAFRNDSEIWISSFSVDPERDSVGQLYKYASLFNIDVNKWNLLTGDKKQIYRLARNSFRVVVTDGDGGPTDFIHSEKLVLVDKKKNIRGYYDGTNEQQVERLIKDIKKLKNEN